MSTAGDEMTRNDSPPPVMVPRFAQPEPGPTSPPSPSSSSDRPEVTEPFSVPRPSLVDRLGLGRSKPEVPGATRTLTSTPEYGADRPRRKPVDEKDAAALLVGVIGAVAVGVAWFVQLRTQGRGQLRRPTERQAGDIAAPIARIAARHVPAEVLNADLVDAVHAITAAGAYVTSGPIVVPATNQQQEEEA